MKIIKPETKIYCNKCENLNILVKKVKLSNVNSRNVLIITCKFGLCITTIEVKNSDLNSRGLKKIKAPFDCPRRQELRKQGKEYKFEMSIIP